MISHRELLSQLRQALPEGKTYKNIYVPDSDGLVIRIGRKGAKGQCTFYCVRRAKGAKQPSWIELGQYPLMTLVEAAAKAGEANELLKRGDDPKAVWAAQEAAEAAAERKKQNNTFESVVERFNLDYRTLTSKKTKALRKSAPRIASAIARLLTPEWGKSPIADIAEDKVETVITAIRKGGRAGPGRRRMSGGDHVAREAFVAARLVFKWAKKKKLIDVDPTAGLEAADLYNGVVPRDRVLKDDELRRVWDAAVRMGNPFGPLVQILILTGARKEEIAQARWSEIEDDTLIVPGNRMKMKKPHAIPLTPKVLEILAGLPRFNGGDYIFTTTFGVKPSLAGSKRKSELDALIGDIPHWVVHDLRRTCRTRLSQLRVMREVAERVIAHIPGGIEGVYNLYEYADEKRAALMKWEEKLLSIVEPEPDDGGKVVPLRRSA